MITFKGLDELIAAIHGLPQALAHQVQPTVTQIATRAADAIRNALPEHTGTLKSRVKVKSELKDPRVAFAMVASTAPHAHLNEYGWHTKGKLRRKIPGKFTVARTAPRFRRQMIEDITPMIDDICQREIQ